MNYVLLGEKMLDIVQYLRLDSQPGFNTPVSVLRYTVLNPLDNDLVCFV